jgi:hypothetical protein
VTTAYAFFKAKLVVVTTKKAIKVIENAILKKSLKKTGLIAMPRKSEQVLGLVQCSIFGIGTV